MLLVVELVVLLELGAAARGKSIYISYIATRNDAEFIFDRSSFKPITLFDQNWKNICQGGASPSFCVFVGNAFKK